MDQVRDHITRDIYNRFTNIEVFWYSTLLEICQNKGFLLPIFSQITAELKILPLTPSWRRSLSYTNQSIDLRCKSVDWFLYDSDLRHERVKRENTCQRKPLIWHIELYEKLEISTLNI